MHQKLCKAATILALTISSCTSTKPQVTQLQIREFQTRVFEHVDQKSVLKAMLNVLQDEGFIIKQGNLDLGLLYAEKQVDVENKTEAVLAVLFLGANARWKKNSMFECSINVSEFGDGARVRANFQLRLLDNQGQLIRIEEVNDPKFYQEFFAKVDKAIFLTREKL